MSGSSRISWRTAPEAPSDGTGTPSTRTSVPPALPRVSSKLGCAGTAQNSPGCNTRFSSTCPDLSRTSIQASAVALNTIRDCGAAGCMGAAATMGIVVAAAAWVGGTFGSTGARTSLWPIEAAPFDDATDTAPGADPAAASDDGPARGEAPGGAATTNPVAIGPPPGDGPLKDGPPGTTDAGDKDAGAGDAGELATVEAEASGADEDCAAVVSGLARSVNGA